MTIRTTTRNARTIARAIWRGEDFTTSGALCGEAFPLFIGTGRMPDSDAAQLRTTDSLMGIDYVVYSYGTPIAYRANEEWIAPDAKYSVTTSKHQSTIRYALELVLTCN